MGFVQVASCAFTLIMPKGWWTVTLVTCFLQKKKKEADVRRQLQQVTMADVEDRATSAATAAAAAGRG